MEVILFSLWDWDAWNETIVRLRNCWVASGECLARVTNCEIMYEWQSLIAKTELFVLALFNNQFCAISYYQSSQN